MKIDMPRFFSSRLLLLSAVIFLVYGTACSDRAEETWFNFDINPSSKQSGQSSEKQSIKRNNISYELEAAFAEIPLPDITDIRGRAKLIHHANPKSAIGYEMNIAVDSLSTSDIPEKYRKERTFQTPAGEATVMPLDEVTYRAKFVFDLKDKDGFTIRSVQSREHSIKSSETNYIKARTPYVVDSIDVALTKDMDVELTVVSCSSCREDE